MFHGSVLWGIHLSYWVPGTRSSLVPLALVLMGTGTTCPNDQLLCNSRRQVFLLTEDTHFVTTALFLRLYTLRKVPRHCRTPRIRLSSVTGTGAGAPWLPEMARMAPRSTSSSPVHRLQLQFSFAPSTCTSRYIPTHVPSHCTPVCTTTTPRRSYCRSIQKSQLHLLRYH